jgi:hypothetical protein
VPHPSTPLSTFASISLCQLLAQQPTPPLLSTIHAKVLDSLGVTINNLRFADLGISNPSALHQRLSGTIKFVTPVVFSLFILISRVSRPRKSISIFIDAADIDQLAMKYDVFLTS